MEINRLTLSDPLFPELLRNIPSPPKELYFAAKNLKTVLERPKVAIVGSRKISPYGKAVTNQLSSELAVNGVVIVSGLALGVDTVAHRAALEVNGLTMAILPSSLDKIYPATHRQLAQDIYEQGGVLMSEYPPGTGAFKQHFIARNRLVSGIADALLITEAAEKSGTMHTARFALEQGKDVVAVPGNITSDTSRGTNNLLKSGAIPITSSQDVLFTLNISSDISLAAVVPKGATEHEQIILDLIFNGESNGDLMFTESNLEIHQFNQALTMLEITGKIKNIGSNNWAL